MQSEVSFFWVGMFEKCRPRVWSHSRSITNCAYEHHDGSTSALSVEHGKVITADAFAAVRAIWNGTLGTWSDEGWLVRTMKLQRLSISPQEGIFGSPASQHAPPSVIVATSFVRLSNDPPNR